MVTGQSLFKLPFWAKTGYVPFIFPSLSAKEISYT
jgi:hypothetical protein